MRKFISFLLVITFLKISFSIAKSDNLNDAGLYSGVHYYDSTLSKSTGTKWIVTGMEPMKETLEIGFKSTF